MRKKPNLIPRMEKCASVQITEPESYRGLWRERLPVCRELWLEIGCGKGRFTLGTAEINPDVILVAVERVADAMVTGMERVCEAGIENIRFISMDAQELPEVFSSGEISRIFINFCDPWPKSRDAKHRLTAPGFLRTYADILPEGGEIHFKTDNRPRFDWSLEQFSAEGWELKELTYNLHENGIQGIMTDYEAKFNGMGIKINRVVAVKTVKTLGTGAGRPERLRDSALSDARMR